MSKRSVESAPESVNGQATPETAAPRSDFDLASICLSQDFITMTGVTKALLTVPVRKPGKSAFVRVHPSAEYRTTAAMIEIEESDDAYLVHPSIACSLMGEPMLGAYQLFTAITRPGTVFIWPIKLPKGDGVWNSWPQSATHIAQLATERWLRIKSNRDLGAYEAQFADSPIPDPEWPEKSLPELLEIAFRNKFIKTPDHPVLQQLRGEV